LTSSNHLATHGDNSEELRELHELGEDDEQYFVRVGFELPLLVSA